MSKTLDRLAKLLAHAEGASTDEERDAFISKAQEIATLAAIDLEVARQHQVTKELREQPTVKRIRLFDRTDNSQNRALFVRLATTIAEFQDVKCDIFHDSRGIVAYGFPSDIEVTEALYASLSAQMVVAGNAFVKGGTWKGDTVFRCKKTKVGSGWYAYTEEDWGYHPIDARIARSSFYEGFREAIRVRLANARTAAMESAPVIEVNGQETSGALVLVSKEKEVRDFHRENSNARGTWKGGSATTSSASGQRAGANAGANASLGSGRGIGGGRAALSA